MYADSFGLRELPFNNTPDPRFFYSTPDHEEALASLVYTVGESKGFMLLTGETGTGKTFLAKLMLAHFGQRILSADICHTHLDTENLLESICIEFGIDVKIDDGPARHANVLQEFLIEQCTRNRPVVLILDEAQNLPVRALEELRLVSNGETSRTKLLQIIMIGQPKLRDELDRPSMRQLKQRLFRIFHLRALTRKQTEAYIGHRLTIAGAQEPTIFDGSAIDVIHELSRGIPRVINTVADNVLLSAYSSGTTRIDAALIRSLPDLRMHLQETIDVPLGEGPPMHHPHLRRPATAETPISMLTPTGYAIPMHDPGMTTRIATLENKIFELTLREAGRGERKYQAEIADRLTAIEQKINPTSQRQAQQDPEGQQTSPTGRFEAFEHRIEVRLASIERTIRDMAAGSDSQHECNARQMAEVPRAAQGAGDEVSQSLRSANRALERIRNQSNQAHRLATALQGIGRNVDVKSEMQDR